MSPIMLCFSCVINALMVQIAFTTLITVERLPIYNSILVAQCRSRCLSKFAIVDGFVSLEFCKAKTNCQMCWKICGALNEKFEFWNHVCSSRGICQLSGCEESCKFYIIEGHNVNNLDYSMVDKFNFSVPISIIQHNASLDIVCWGHLEEIGDPLQSRGDMGLVIYVLMKYDFEARIWTSVAQILANNAKLESQRGKTVGFMLVAVNSTHVLATQKETYNHVIQLDSKLKPTSAHCYSDTTRISINNRSAQTFVKHEKSNNQSLDQNQRPCAAEVEAIKEKIFDTLWVADKFAIALLLLFILNSLLLVAIIFCLTCVNMNAISDGLIPDQAETILDPTQGQSQSGCVSVSVEENIKNTKVNKKLHHLKKENFRGITVESYFHSNAMNTASPPISKNQGNGSYSLLASPYINQS